VNFEANGGYVCELIASKLRLMLHQEHMKQSPGWSGFVTLVVEPIASRAVVAAKDIPAKKLTFVPLSPNLTVKATGSTPQNVVDLGTVLSDGKFDAFAYVVPFIKKPATSDNHEKKTSTEFYSPFWSVSSTSDVKKANMVFELMVVEFHGDKFDVPVLINPKVVKKGEPLAYYRQANTGKYPKMNEFKGASGAKKRRIGIPA